MSAALLGLGTAVPEHTMSQDEAAQLACDVCCEDDRQRRLLRVLYRRSGVRNRHTALPYKIAYEYPAGSPGPTTRERTDFYRRLAPPLAESAARAALADAGTSPGDITHLITVTCTGFVAPGTDAHLITSVGLPSTAERVNVGFMGCHGALNGLRVAAGLIAARPEARVLLCAAELCSLHYRFRWDPDRFLGNALFADGAAAAVLGDAGGWGVTATGSKLFAGSDDAMTWDVGDNGFEMSLSSSVPGLIEAELRDWLAGWLAGHGVGLEDVRSWAVHPGGPRILTAVEAALALKADDLAVSRSILADYGNMSSPTVLFILEALRRSGAAWPCVALGFGPGLAAEAVLLGPFSRP